MDWKQENLSVHWAASVNLFLKTIFITTYFHDIRKVFDIYEKGFLLMLNFTCNNCINVYTDKDALFSVSV